MTFDATVVVARCCYTLSQMISVEENSTPTHGGIALKRRSGVTAAGGYMRCTGLGVWLSGKERGVVQSEPEWLWSRGGGSECPDGEREISMVEGRERKGNWSDVRPLLRRIVRNATAAGILGQDKINGCYTAALVVVAGEYLGVYVCVC